MVMRIELFREILPREENVCFVRNAEQSCGMALSSVRAAEKR